MYAKELNSLAYQIELNLASQSIFELEVCSTALSIVSVWLNPVKPRWIKIFTVGQLIFFNAFAEIFYPRYKFSGRQKIFDISSGHSLATCIDI